MIKTIRDIWRKKAILAHFVGAQLTSSYRTKSLGFLWALLDPLLYMAVYYLVFGKIMAHRPTSFMLHLFIGVIAFRFLNTASTQAAGILRSRSGIIREIPFPTAVLPVSVVLARLFDFGAGLLIAIPLSIIFGSPPTAYWLLLPFIVIIQTLFVLGFSFLMAYIGVFFADIQNILSVVLRLWFYMSPVLYPLQLVQSKTADRPLIYKIYMANPMTNLLQSYENLVQGGQWPQLEHVAYALASSIVLFLLGLFAFSRWEGQIEKYV